MSTMRASFALRRCASSLYLLRPHRGAHLFLLLAQLVLYTLLLAGTTAAADSSCAFSLTGQVRQPYVLPDKRSTVRIEAMNPSSSTTVVAVQLRLPQNTTYKTGNAKSWRPRLARIDGSRRPVYDPDTHTVAWANITLRPRGVIKLSAKVRLEPCYPGPHLNFSYVAFATDEAGNTICSQDGVASVAVKDKKMHFGRAIPDCGPISEACIPGQFRPPAGGPCQFCTPGTYWNLSFEAIACLNCPSDQTSLQGAAQCFTPCASGTALNTTDLSCVPIPASVFDDAAANNITIDVNTTEVFVVNDPGSLEDTIGAAALMNGTVLIVLAPNLYPQVNSYVLTANLMVLAGSPLQGGRRRLTHASHRELQGTDDETVIYATGSNRHFVMSNADIWLNGITLQGASTGPTSGGVELQNGAKGLFVSTKFRACRSTGEGGSLRLIGGSSCSVGTGSVFVSNAGAQGGAIYAGAGCSVTVNNTVSFTNNSAPRTSSSASGGGAIYLASTASLLLDYDVAFTGNVNDDVTITGGSVSCLNSLYSTGLVNCTSGCTGSYKIPASCPVCSMSSGSTCTSCPQGSFGGSSAALVCQHCPYGYTTIYPPSSVSPFDCILITDSPTLSPTSPGDTVSPTSSPTIAAPTVAPTKAPTPSPTTEQPTVSPTPVGYKAPAMAHYYHDSCIATPTVPSPPSFADGALLTAGSGGTYALLSQAIDAASAGDRIQILPGIIEETATVTVSKSLEIFGTGPDCIVQRDSTTAVITIAAGTNDVYIHTLGVINNQVPSTDPGGLSSCITAATMQTATPNGATGIYIANSTFTFPKMGVSIDASDWVVRDCVFTPNANAPGTTLRALAPYGSTGQSFATGNTFNNPSESSRLIAVFMTAAGPRGASFTTGWKGNFTLANNAISTSGGAPRAYIDTTGMYRQPGDQSDLGSNGEFSMYIQGNDFQVNYTSSPALFYVGYAQAQAFGFFDVLLVKDNVFGARTSGSQKGALYFTSSQAGILGFFAGGFYAGGNSFSTSNIELDSNYVDASFTPNLLVINTNTFTAPSPLITSIYPAAATGLLKVDSIQLVAGDRVFAVDNCDAVKNGLYTSEAGAWPRTTDFAVGMDVYASFFQVMNGTEFGGTSWNCTNEAGSAVVGTDALFFSQA